jgi:hypothetical protein
MQNSPHRAVVRSRKSLAVALMVLAGAGVGAGAAYAASYVYIDGNMNAGDEAWSNLVGLTSSEGLSYDGRLVCVAALDTSWNQVGTVSCTTSASGIGKPYNGTTRRAYLRPGAGAGASAKGRAVY